MTDNLNMPQSSQLVIILLGPPGSGKGTQCRRLAEEYGLPHISSGDLFREQMSAGTPIGQKAKSYIQAGQLVPDEVTLGMVFERIDKPDCAKGYLIDGVPRTVEQANQLAEHPSMKGKLLVLCLDVKDDEIIKRAAGRIICRECGQVYNLATSPPIHDKQCDKCGGELYRRADDEPEVVRKRLQVYHEQTQPLLKYYEERKFLTTFDGSQSPDRVHAQLKEYIDHQLKT